MLEIKASYAPSGGYVDNGRGHFKVGGGEGELYPYDMLLGGLSACYHATLKSVLDKMKVPVPQVDYVITGEKRSETPTTLTWVNMDITITGDVDQKQMQRALDMAAKYCSIHHTIAQVAEMRHEVHFK